MALTREVIEIVVKEEGTDAYDRLDADQQRLQKHTAATDAGLAKVSGTLLNLSSAVQVAQAGIAAFGAAVSALKGPVNLAISFEAEFAKVRTLMQGASAATVKDIESGLLDLAKRVPQTAADITQSAYQAISAGVKPAEVLGFLESASKAAIGGSVSMKTAVDVLSTSVAAFGRQGVDAARAADVLFATVVQGRTDFEQLAASLGQGAQLGSMGVTFEEVNAAAATLTKTLGISTAEAFTRINSLVAQISRGVPGLKSLGVETGIAALQAKGLAGVLADIQRATGGSEAELGALFVRQEAVAAILGLGGENAQVFAETLDAVTNSTGQASAASDILGEATQGAVDALKAAAEGVLTDLGSQLLPVVHDAILALAEAVRDAGPAIVDTFTAIGSIARASLPAVTALANAAASAVGAVGSLAGGARAATAQGQALLDDKAAADQARAASVLGEVISGGEGNVGARLADEMTLAVDRLTQAEGALADLRAAENADQVDRFARELGFRSDQERALKGEAALARQRIADLEAAARLEQTLGGTGGFSAAPSAGEDALFSEGPQAVIGQAKKPRGAAGRAGRDPDLIDIDAVIRESQSLEDARMQAAASAADARLAFERDLQDRSVAFIEDEAVRKLTALELSQARERELAEQHGMDMGVLARIQAEEQAVAMEDLAKRQAAAEAERVRASIAARDALIDSAMAVVGAIGDAAGAGDKFKAAMLVIDAAFHGVKASEDAALAASAFAIGNWPQGAALTASALKHTAVVITATSTAAKIGKGSGGGGASAGGVGARGAPADGRPARRDVPERGMGGGKAEEIHVHIDTVLPPDPAYMDRAAPQMMEAFRRVGLTRGGAGLPGAGAFR